MSAQIMNCIIPKYWSISYDGQNYSLSNFAEIRIENGKQKEVVSANKKNYRLGQMVTISLGNGTFNFKVCAYENNRCVFLIIKEDTCMNNDDIQILKKMYL
jgi:hypothetical protein